MREPHRAPPPDASETNPSVATLGEDPDALGALLSAYGMALCLLEPEAVIPGSYWGESEAGLIGDRLYVRPDTPIHSALHEASHYICMDPPRRAGLHTDAGGDFAEEDAVCYLQILLADRIPGFARGRMMADMDSWGYTFRLGSAKAWFSDDASDARDWLLARGLIDEKERPTGSLRTR